MKVPFGEKTKAAPGDKRKATSDGQSGNWKKRTKTAEITPKKTSKAETIERATALFMDYQRQADELYLKPMAEQREIDA